MDMDAFVKKEQGQQTDIYYTAGETWLNDLSSFMDKEMAEKKNWWKKFDEVYTEAVQFWSLFQE